MAILALTNANIWAGLSDLTNDSNEVSIEADVAALDSTTFASGGWTSALGGLRSGKFMVKGLWDAGTADLPDNLNFTNLGTGSIPVTVTPIAPAVAGVAYMGSFMQPSYKTGGKVGDLLTFETNAVSDAPIVRGQVASIVAKTATGTTASLNLGAVGANQRIYANIHVLSITGTATPSLTVAVQSDTATGFPAPTTVVTSSAITTVSSVQLRGPVGVSANTWQRLSLTITGTTPSFLLYAAIGIA